MQHFLSDGVGYPGQLISVCMMAFVAAVVNAVAGGGTFLLFPTLTGVAGLTEKAANIASTIGLFPGSATSAVAARHQLAKLPRRIVVSYVLVCLLGGTIGAELLKHTTEKTFHYVIPWLLLFATVVFSMGKRISRWAGREAAMAGSHGHSAGWAIFVGAVQFLLSIYGGYFGAGMSILTLAGLSLVGLGDIKQVNVLKMLLAACTNLTAAILFVFGPVAWQYAGPMAISAAVGGYVGMHAAQRLSQAVLRGTIIVIASLLTAAFFWKVYG
jgi:uncharacterized membrane protein YfcA